MSGGYVPFLPSRLREPIEAMAKAMGYDPETVFVGTLASQEIAKLPRAEQAKAIAIVVRLYETAMKDAAK